MTKQRLCLSCNGAFSVSLRRAMVLIKICKLSLSCFALPKQLL